MQLHLFVWIFIFVYLELGGNEQDIIFKLYSYFWKSDYNEKTCDSGSG